ncbi:MAG TPA: Sec-independent protein translocase subunit TatA [Actinocrinis sp.]|nr:Sec-independent protein translocase subunit TatA [Actinocrinis sp.]
MLNGLEGWHIVLIVLVAALLFGSGKLPGAARSIGQSLRIFKSEMKAGAQDDTAPGTANAAGPAFMVDAPAPVPVAPQVVQNPAGYTPSPTPVAEPLPVPVAQVAGPLPAAGQHTVL